MGKARSGGALLRAGWRTKKTKTDSENCWNLKQKLGSDFTLEVFIFRKTEHRQPIKICVHWGIPVSWHDNLLFKCTAAFLPYTTEHSRQLIHYHWAFFSTLSLCFPTSFPPFCPLLRSLLRNPDYVLLLNQTGLDRERQRRSESALHVWRWTSRGRISGGVIGGE